MAEKAKKCPMCGKSYMGAKCPTCSKKPVKKAAKPLAKAKGKAPVSLDY